MCHNYFMCCYWRTKALSTLSQKSATVAENGETIRLGLQSHFSATVWTGRYGALKLKALTNMTVDNTILCNTCSARAYVSCSSLQVHVGENGVIPSPLGISGNFQTILWNFCIRLFSSCKKRSAASK